MKKINIIDFEVKLIKMFCELKNTQVLFELMFIDKQHTLVKFSFEDYKSLKISGILDDLTGKLIHRLF